MAHKAPASVRGGASGQTLVPGAKELASMAGARVRMDEAGQVIGLSGLSEMMRQDEARSRKTGRPAQAGSVGAAPKSGRSVKRTTPPPPPQSSSRSVYMLISGVCLGVILVTATHWYTSLPPADEAAGSDPAGAAHRLPLVPATRLTHEPWDRPNQPFDHASHTDEQDPAAHVAEADVQTLLDGEPHMVGTVVANQPAVITFARVHISLVDQAGVEVARTHTTVAMVAPGHQYRLRLPIPEDLADQPLEIASSVVVLDAMADATFLEGVTAELTGNEANPRLRLSAVNTSDQPMRRIVFLVTAMDTSNQPVSRWRVAWSEPVASGQPIVYEIPTPTVPAQQIGRWHVEAVGQPLHDADASANHDASTSEGHAAIGQQENR